MIYIIIYMYNWNPCKGNPARDIFLSKLEIFPV